MRKYYKYIVKLFIKYIRISMLLLILKGMIMGLEIMVPVLLQNLVDKGIVPHNIHFLVKSSFVVIFSIIILNSINFLFNKFSVKVNLEQTFILKKKIMGRLAMSNLDFYNKTQAGDILKTLEGDIVALETISLGWFISTVIEIVGGIFTLGIIFKINYVLLMVVLVAETFIILFQKKFVTILSNNAVTLRKMSGKSMGYIEEYVSNIVSAVICKTTDYMKDRFVNNEEILNQKLDDQYNIAEGNQLISNGIDRILTVLIYFIGGIFVINQKMSYGELIAFSQYIGLIVAPILTIINSFSKIQLAVVSLEKVEGLLDLPIIKDGNKVSQNVLESSICFKNVTLAYEDKPVLKHLNMCFEGGKIYAIIGKNGSGKSTIIKSLYRMIEPLQGEISVFDENIKEWDLKTLRDSIGIVSQEVFIMNDTIYNNITLGRVVSDEEFQEVIDIVQLGSLVKNSREAKEIEAGENGIALSGGQRQKIAIARMLLLKTKILVFDEATAAIDNIAQDNIIKSVMSNYRNRTIIVIGHRKDLLQYADYYYYLENNSISEQGEISDLSSKKGKAYGLLCEATIA